MRKQVVQGLTRSQEYKSKIMPAKAIKFWWALFLWNNLFFICRKKSNSVEIYKIIVAKGIKL